jgi:hypothetical protein
MSKKDNMHTYGTSVVVSPPVLEFPTSKYRVIVLGQSVSTVQYVSRYCLAQGADVLPYYGFPTLEEVELFDPQILIFCLPVPESLLKQFSQPCILWSEQNEGLPQVSTRKDLEATLQTLFQITQS